jgi:hypothetical protein
MISGTAEVICDEAWDMFSDVVCNFLSFGNNILLKVSDSSQF